MGRNRGRERGLRSWLFLVYLGPDVDPTKYALAQMWTPFTSGDHKRKMHGRLPYIFPSSEIRGKSNTTYIDRTVHIPLPHSLWSMQWKSQCWPAVLDFSCVDLKIVKTTNCPFTYALLGCILSPGVTARGRQQSYKGVCINHRERTRGSIYLP